MPTYIKTISFSTYDRFNPVKDDPEVNGVLDQLQAQRAKIVDVKVSLGGSSTSGKVTATYIIIYEAPTPIY